MVTFHVVWIVNLRTIITYCKTYFLVVIVHENLEYRVRVMMTSCELDCLLEVYVNASLEDFYAERNLTFILAT